MAKAKGQGASKKNAYANYKAESRYEKNRRKRLERAIKQQPNNEQLKQALNSISYRRKKPNSKYGWVSSKDGRYNPFADQDYTGPAVTGAYYRSLSKELKASKGIENDRKYRLRKEPLQKLSNDLLRFTDEFQEFAAKKKKKPNTSSNRKKHQNPVSTKRKENGQ